MVRPYKLQRPLEDKPLLNGMNQIFTFMDSVIFHKKQEVLLSLSFMVTNTAQLKAPSSSDVYIASRPSLALCLFSLAKH